MKVLIVLIVICGGGMSCLATAKAEAASSPASQPAFSGRLRVIRFMSTNFGSSGFGKPAFGFINTAGQVVIPLQSGRAWPFSGNRSLFQSPNGLLGYLNRHGKKIIPAQYQKATSFYNNRAFVQKKNGPIEIIDGMGHILCKLSNKELVTRPRDYLLSVFFNIPPGYTAPPIRYAVFKNPSTELMGTINNHGHVIVKAHYFRIGLWKNGLAPIKNPVTKWMAKGTNVVITSHLVGFINDTGHIVIPFRFKVFRGFYEALYYYYGFSEGLASVSVLHTQQGSYGGAGYINQSGHWVISPQFSIADHFSEGLADVVPESPKRPGWAYIDKSGHYVTAPKFMEARPFSEGLGVVEMPPLRYSSKPAEVPSDIQGKWGAIYPNGNWAINPIFDDIGLFRNGFARARKGNIIGYINHSGKWVWVTPNSMKLKKIHHHQGGRKDEDCFGGNKTKP